MCTFGRVLICGEVYTTIRRLASPDQPRAGPRSNALGGRFGAASAPCPLFPLPPGEDWGEATCLLAAPFRNRNGADTPVG